MSEGLMPILTEDTRAFLNMLSQGASSAPLDPSIGQRRAGLSYFADEFGPNLSQSQRGTIKVEDITISTPEGPLDLRLYYPPNIGAQKTRPAIVVHIHGGGWVLGDLDCYSKVCYAYCLASESVIVDVHYRRAPENKYPSALNDCLYAIDWAAKHAHKLGADAKKLVVTGDSAGGNLAASACLMTNTRPALQILVYPVISAREHADYKSRKSLGDGRYFLGEFDIKRAEDEYLSDPSKGEEIGASPIMASLKQLSHLPPTLVYTASLDPLRDEAIAYVTRLQDAKISVKHIEALGTIHGFILFAGAIAKGMQAIETIGQAIKSVKPRPARSWFT